METSRIHPPQPSRARCPAALRRLAPGPSPSGRGAGSGAVSRLSAPRDKAGPAASCRELGGRARGAAGAAGAQGAQPEGARTGWAPAPHLHLDSGSGT